MFLLDSSFWHIRQTKQKGRGIFASKTIPPGETVGDYLGLIVPVSADVGKDDVYCMWYGEKALISPIDRSAIDIHCINYSCMPNCALYPLEDHMLFVTQRKIFKGEELTANYYLIPDSPKDMVDICYCKTPLCHGAMYVSQYKFDAFVTVEKKMRGRFYSHQSTKIGSVLAPLSRYPKKIKDLPVHDLYGSTSEKPVKFPDTILPTRSRMRSYIRTEGTSIAFPALGLRVLGVEDTRYCIEKI